MFASKFAPALLFATASAVTYEGAGAPLNHTGGDQAVGTNYKYQIDIVQDNGRTKHQQINETIL